MWKRYPCRTIWKRWSSSRSRRVRITRNRKKDVDTDDDDRAAAVRTDAGQDENVGQGELSQKDRRRRDKGDGRENDDEDDDEDEDDDGDEGVRVQTHFEISAASGAQKEEKKAPPVTIDLLGTLRAKFEITSPARAMPASRFATPASAWPARSIRNWLTVWRSTSRTRERSRWSMRIWGPNSIRDSVSRSDLCGSRLPSMLTVPHTQYFANRSFIAKQVGSVRDVGATLGWKFGEKVPINLQVGMFNGSGIDDQKDFWTDNSTMRQRQFGSLPRG